MKSIGGRFVIGAVLCASISTALGQATSAPTPTTLAILSTNLPPPQPYPLTYGSSPTSLRFGPNGQLYASDGAMVWEQTGGYSGSFTMIGTVPSTGSDPGTLNFSSDGQTIVVSNGGGGPNGMSANGVLYSLPVPSGNVSPVNPLPTAAYSGTIPFNFDFIPTPLNSGIPNPGTSFLVDFASGSGGVSSQVDMFNSSAGAVAAIQNIPGASTSLAISGANAANFKLYVGVGYGASPGEIATFSLSTVAAAVKNNMPLDWSAGTVVNPNDIGNNSGSGMFVDPRGYIFAGGPGGVEVIVPGSNSAYASYVFGIPYDTGGDLMTSTSVSYNSITNQFAVQGYDSTGSFPLIARTNVYSASQFATTNLLAWTGIDAANSTWQTNGNSTTWASNASNPIYADGATVTFGDTNPNSPTSALVYNTNGVALVQIAANGVMPAAVMFTNTGAANGVDYTITGGPIGGPATIELYGNGTIGGTVTLMSPNSFTGPVVIAAGVLKLQDPAALGNSSGVSVIAGAALQLQHSTSSPATFGLTASNASSIPLNLYGTDLDSNAGELNSVGGNNTYGGAINVGMGGGQIVSSSTSGSDRLTLSGGVNISAGSMLTVAGPGATTISDAGLSLGDSSTLDVSSGTLTIALGNGTGAASVGSGTTVAIASAASLQLAGAVSALGTAGGSRAHIINDSTTAGGLVVSAADQVVGAIDGAGLTTVDAGGSLTADHIVQVALVIGGNSMESARVTIAASSDQAQNLAVLTAPETPFGEGIEPAAVLADSMELDSAIGSWPLDRLGTAALAEAVPEPSPSAMVLIALAAMAVWSKWTKFSRCDCVAECSR